MPGAVIVRSDVERKALFGVGETEKLPEDAYSATVNARVYAVLADKARRILGAGHAAIVDAVFAQPSERAALAATSKAAQVPLQGALSHRESRRRAWRASIRAEATPPMPPETWRGPRKTTASARSIGGRSMPPARLKKLRQEPAQRWIDEAFRCRHKAAKSLQAIPSRLSAIS